MLQDAVSSSEQCVEVAEDRNSNHRMRCVVPVCVSFNVIWRRKKGSNEKRTLDESNNNVESLDAPSSNNAEFLRTLNRKHTAVRTCVRVEFSLCSKYRVIVGRFKKAHSIFLWSSDFFFKEHHVR